jgi:hypothetical protein
MSVGDPGPYMNESGDIWVPRTVPYLDARKIAGEAVEWGQVLTYVGKVEAGLLGFTRDCRCDETCEREQLCAACGHDHEGLNPCYRDVEGCTCPTFDAGNKGCCLAPAWHFRADER